MVAAIAAEHALARPLTASDIAAFVADGVPPAALSWTPCGQVSMLARERVVFDRPFRRRFEFERHERGWPAVNAFTLPLLGLDGTPCDILAWRPGGTVGTWDGIPAVAGEEQVLAPRLDDALDVHETVLDWLKAGRHGIVILSRKRAAEILDGVTLRARSWEHMNRLRQRLVRPAPRIVVADQVAQAA